MEGGTIKKRSIVKKKVIAIVGVVIMLVQSNLFTLAAEVDHEVSVQESEQLAVDYIDISTNVQAELTYNGQKISKEVTLHKEDFSKKTVKLEVEEEDVSDLIDWEKVSVQEETDQVRIKGSYPIGTKENPVIYTLKLVKDVTFEIGEKSETISMTFTKNFGYWSEDNICGALKEEGAKISWSDGNCVENSGIGIMFQTSKAELTVELPEDEVKEEVKEETPEAELPKDETKEVQEETPQEETPQIEPLKEEEPLSEEEKTGNLAVKMTVVGEMDWDDVFEIKVTGEDTEYSKTEQLKNGDSFTLENIPVGTYKIEVVKALQGTHLYETTILVNGKKSDTAKSCKVDIKEDSSVEVHIKSTVKTVEWKVENVKSEILLTGRDMKAKEFQFEVTDGKNIITTGTASGAKKAEKSTINWIDATVIYHTTGTYQYTVRQTIPTVKAGGVTYDTNTFQIVVNVTNTDGTLKAEAKYPTNGIVFTNVYDVVDAPISIGGTVTLDGGNRKLQAKEFVFTLVETDKNGTALNNAQIIEMYNTENGVFGTTIIYKLKDVGTHYYVVTQKVLGEKGMKYGITKYLIQVDVSDNGDGTLKVAAKNHENITFTNIYEAEKKFSVQTKVTLEGRKIEAKEFSFKLKAVTANAPMPKSDTAVNDADGNVAFGDITYDEDDIGKTYVYQIYQLKGNGEKITYDKSTYQISVTIKDKGNAELTVSQSIVPTFKNIYGEVAVKTGDNTPILLYFGTMTAAFMVLSVIGLRKKNRNI